ncbi:hypothetical protein HDU97_010309 [Phlyctochytrium planicorne]|nr:hypothetical protein HDU97_010309 [Phlyctochytrium planicorne]
MATSLNMSLDDIISQNKKTGGGGWRRRGGRGGASGQGGVGPVRNNRRSAGAPRVAAAPYAREQQSAKIMISNLNPAVTEAELRELFRPIGPVKSVVLNYDATGKSKGSGTAIFQRAEDALKAIHEYHNRELDRRPMRLELVMSATSISSLGSAAPAAGASNGSSRGPGGGRGGPRRGRGGRGRGGSSAPRKPKSAADLDADLDSYMRDETMADAPADPSANMMTL